MNDIIVRIINLPASVRGVTVVDENGNYNIYINAKLAPDEQKKALEHEQRHIDNFDFESFEEIEEIEKRAEGRKS